MTRQDTPVKDRSGKIWHIHLTSGYDGTINVSIKDGPRKRYGEFMSFWEFVRWAKKKRIHGLPYRILMGPNAAKYGRTPIFKTEEEF